MAVGSKRNPLIIDIFAEDGSLLAHEEVDYTALHRQRLCDHTCPYCYTEAEQLKRRRSPRREQQQ